MSSQHHVFFLIRVRCPEVCCVPCLHCQSYTWGCTSASCTSTPPKLISVFHTSISTCSWSLVSSCARDSDTPQAPAALIHTLSSAAPQVTLRGRSGPA